MKEHKPSADNKSFQNLLEELRAREAWSRQMRQEIQQSPFFKALEHHIKDSKIGCCLFFDKKNLCITSSASGPVSLRDMGFRADGLARLVISVHLLRCDEDDDEEFDRSEGYVHSRYVDCSNDHHLTVFLDVPIDLLTNFSEKAFNSFAEEFWRECVLGPKIKDVEDLLKKAWREIENVHACSVSPSDESPILGVVQDLVVKAGRFIEDAKLTPKKRKAR